MQAGGLSPMGRMVVGTLATSVAFVFIGPEAALAVGAVFGFWVVVGVARAVHAATDKPSEHHVLVAGAVEHVVADGTQRPPPRAKARAAIGPRTAFVECPRCSSLVGPTAAACSCGWEVPEVARPRELPAGAGIERDPALAVATSTAAARPAVCPACPQCRAPTEWVEEFERFLCKRCDVYVG